MITIDKTNKTLWNTESTLLDDLSYMLYVNAIKDTNKFLYENNKDVRISYMMYSNFIKNKFTELDYFKKKAKTMLREDKISKLKLQYE